MGMGGVDGRDPQERKMVVFYDGQVGRLRQREASRSAPSFWFVQQNIGLKSILG